MKRDPAARAMRRGKLSEREAVLEMVWFAVLVSAAAAGLVQTVTGFGSAIMLMLALPYFFDMLHAPALASAITLGLSVGLAWRFRKLINYRQTLPLAAVYVMASTLVISKAGALDLNLLSMAFGLFLILLSLYYLLLPKSVSLRPSLWSALLCAAAAGVCGGMFGIGGPLLVVYFLAVSESKNSYLANLQLLFAITNLVNTLTRAYYGIYTLALVPLTLVGILGINLGKLVGLRVLDRIDIERMKQVVYVFVGISGVLTLVGHL